MKNTIWFDLDGVLVSLYNVPNWLNKIKACDPSPYIDARPLVNLSRLTRYLNRLQKMGHEIGVISWLSKNSTPEYDAMVSGAKMFWLGRYLPSVKWNEIKIVPYGTNKWDECGEGILFDDDAQNRDSWQGNSYEPEQIFEILIELMKAA